MKRSGLSQGWRSARMIECGENNEADELQRWTRQVAYASQFADPDNRAHIGKAKIRSRLIANLDPYEWDLPPKPKWMRWRTYNNHVERFDAYEAILGSGVAELLAKLLAAG